MRYKIFICGFVLLLLQYKCWADGYLAGTARVSIEPDSSVFSLSLAGYGYPGEGRFTLKWEESGEIPGVKGLAGEEKGLYALTAEGELRRGRWEKGRLEWKTLEKNTDFCFITVCRNKIYAIDSKNRLWVKAVSGRKWKEMETVHTARGFTSGNGKLYLATDKDEMWEGVPDRDHIGWRKIGKAEQVLGLAVAQDRLYALTANQILWQHPCGETYTPWLKIGYQNGINWKEPVYQIAVAANRLFAVGKDGKLYKAVHSTEGGLTARALALTSGKKTVLVITADLCGFDISMITEVKAEIEARTGIPAEAILVNASHTHFAPVSQGWYTWAEHNQLPDTLYLHGVVKPGLVKAAVEALKNRREVRLYFARTHTSIGGNRSLSGEEALYDSTLDVLETIDSKNGEKNVLFLTGCHAVFRNARAEGFRISPNFPGVARQLVEAVGIKNALFIQGCAGDINPMHEDHWKTGEILAADVQKALSGQLVEIRGELSWGWDSVLIPIKAWDKEKIKNFKEENSGQAGNLEAEKNVRWADLMLKRYEENCMPVNMPVYVQTLRIGNWKLVGLSREAVTEYGIAIRNIWPDQLVSVAAYCNDVPSYLPTDPHIRAADYEGYGSFFWYGQPACFPKNILSIIVEKIKINNR